MNLVFSPSLAVFSISPWGRAMPSTFGMTTRPGAKLMKSKKASVSHRERLVEELKHDPALAAEYLNVAAEDGDAQSYLLALRTVAEAQGMTKVAKAAGVPRESIYRALSSKGNPRLSTLTAVLKAAGLKMTVATSVRRQTRAA
jgi:probable addiction module antidote protein